MGISENPAFCQKKCDKVTGRAHCLYIHSHQVIHSSVVSYAVIVSNICYDIYGLRIQTMVHIHCVVNFAVFFIYTVYCEYNRAIISCRGICICIGRHQNMSVGMKSIYILQEQLIES